MYRLLIIYTFATLSIIGLYAQESSMNPVAKEAQGWMANGIIYQIWPRSFTAEGTLRAATERLSDIADLGATIVYLCPIMYQDRGMDKRYWSPRQRMSPANNPRNPYRIMDYTRIDPEYRDENDFKNFVSTAHELGLKVLLDLVYLHTGPNSDLMLDPNNYVKDSVGNVAYNNWNFARLDYSNENLRKYLISNMIDWIEKYEFDGWRCDVSAGVPLDFWEEAREELDKINPGIGMLAESDKPDELLKAFDASYGFAWFEALEDVFVNGKSATLISERWSQMESGFPKGTHFIRWIDNHDRDRAVIVFSEKGSMAASTLNFMLDGIPFIYNGQEIGDATPYGAKYYPEKSYRDNGAIIWGAQGLPHQQELRDWYKKLIAIRKNEPVLRSGKTLWLATDHPQDIIAFLRCNDKEEILTIINVSNRMIDKISVKVSDRNKYVYDSILSSEKVDDLIVRNNKLTLSLGSFGYHVCKVRK